MRTDVKCLQCRMSDPLTELAAVAEVRAQDRITPGLLAYYPCPEHGGYHLTIAGKRDDARRPKDIA